MLKRISSSFLKKAFNFRNSSKFSCHSVDNNDATRNFLESVTSTIKGIQHVNYIEEFDPNLAEEEKAKRKRFLIYRSNPAVNNLIRNKNNIFLIGPK